MYLSATVFTLHEIIAENNHLLGGIDARLRRLLEPRGSGLELLKSTLNAEKFICRLSWSISSHFVAI